MLDAQCVKFRPYHMARRVTLPAERPSKLQLRVASDAKWKLLVLVSGKEVFNQAVEGKNGGDWQNLEVDLAPFAGQGHDVKG